MLGADKMGFCMPRSTLSTDDFKNKKNYFLTDIIHKMYLVSKLTSEVAVSYYTTAEIIKRIPGLTVRTLIDLTEKGFIRPACDTSGQGTPRQYDDENLFQIAVALELRKVLTRSDLKGFMETALLLAKKYDTVIFHLSRGGKTRDISATAKNDDGTEYHLLWAATGGENTDTRVVGFEKKNDLAENTGVVDIVLNARKLREQIGS
jgi:hypothetical protein